jgi:NAD(P)-dependent dehydrogenase (short-subunit alcohol dehydrogenase family)
MPKTPPTPEQIAAWQGGFRKMLADIPMGRGGEPQELAGVALLLASDASSYITGEWFTGLFNAASVEPGHPALSFRLGARE